jgi:hypothetical protein
LGFTNNSNAVIRSILAANNITLEDNLPSNMTTFGDAPGHDTILGGLGNDAFTVGNTVEHIDGDIGIDNFIEYGRNRGNKFQGFHAAIFASMYDHPTSQFM